MKTNAQHRRSELDKQDWLRRLLADVKNEVALQPNPQALGRIRDRVMAEIKTPLKAAA